ncbi:hypothetical protein D9756_000017 [Leucocoprinus leucothites]|uniref:Uncharacterized protein n=1 Tax=Leucocoprinus leucothites TaxID=201217 RepID=A0A8H5GE56_9AGAR|nr:hypothetical protein D9756_000017 [Leucoagaricus leucothites]
MIQVSTLMLALATAHLIIAFIWASHGFSPVDGKIHSEIFGRLYAPIYRAKISIYFMQTIMADALMAWRCYVIYNRTWWILIPGTLGILLDIATLIVRLLPARYPIDSDPLGINGLIPLGCRIAFLTTTMTLHLSCSAAIIYKIHSKRRTLQHTTRKISPVIFAIIESAVYTIAVFLLLLFNLLNSFGQFVVMDVIIPLVLPGQLRRKRMFVNSMLNVPAISRGNTIQLYRGL